MSKPALINDDALNAFCRDSVAYLEGRAEGLLSGLTFAAKDIFDVAGHVTGGGNPDWKATHDAATYTAWPIEALVDVGATLVGKTHTVELTRGIFGENPHYGTPVNPRAPGHDPGGSSNGSASAVAGGLVDFALGSDTLGSVRIPASNCGLYGMRTTHGRIPLDGMMLQAPSYDTVGWLARDAEMFSRVGSVLLRDGPTSRRPARLVVAEDAFELADETISQALKPFVENIAGILGGLSSERLADTSLSEWHQQQLILQSREAWHSVKDWVDRVNPRMSYLVAKRYVFASEISNADIEAATAKRSAIQKRMAEVLGSDTVVCLPTAAKTARPLHERLSVRQEIQETTYCLVTIASTVGVPQINLPLAEVDGLPVGLSLMGPRASDEMLMELALEIENAISPSTSSR
jgi:amidase